MKRVAVGDVDERLSRLLDEVARGEEFVFSKDGRPIARLVAIHRPLADRVPGSARGAVWVSDDFDTPLPPL